MWAQLIDMRLKPGEDTAEMAAGIKAAEQPGSGLVRSLLMHDQSDPSRVLALAVFEDEEKARAREADPRRQESLEPVRELMAAIFDGPPGFTDLVVDDEWTVPAGDGPGG
jgi:hypothetical protein